MSRRPLTTLILLMAAACLVGSVGLAGAASPKAKTFNWVPVEDIPVKAPPVSRTAQEASAGAVSQQVTVPRSSVGKQDGRLSVLAGGKCVRLRNGGRIDLANGVSAELYLDPYPPATSKLWLDVHLVRSVGGKAVSGAKASMTYDMTTMTMGRRTADAEDTGDGHYLYTVEYGMYGEWQHTLAVRVDKTTHELRLMVEALPGL